MQCASKIRKLLKLSETWDQELWYKLKHFYFLLYYITTAVQYDLWGSSTCRHDQQKAGNSNLSCCATMLSLWPKVKAGIFLVTPTCYRNRWNLFEMLKFSIQRIAAIILSFSIKIPGTLETSSHLAQHLSLMAENSFPWSGLIGKKTPLLLLMQQGIKPQNEDLKLIHPTEGWGNFGQI